MSKSKMSKEEIVNRCQIFTKLNIYFPGINDNSIFYSTNYSDEFLNQLLKVKVFQANYGCNFQETISPESFKIYQELMKEYQPICLNIMAQYYSYQNVQQYFTQQYMNQQYMNQQYYGAQNSYNQQYRPFQQPEAQSYQNPPFYQQSNSASYQTANPQHSSFKAQRTQNFYQQSSNYRQNYPQDSLMEAKQKKSSRNYIQKQSTQIQNKIQIIVEEKAPIVIPEPPKPTKYTVDQIKNFFSKFGKTTTVNVTQKLIKDVSEMNSWNKTEQTVQIKQNQPKLNKNNSKNYKNNNDNFQKGGNTKPSGDFQTGVNHKKDTSFVITFGINETLEGNKLKNIIKQQAEKTNYAEEQKLKALSLDDIERAKLQIVYNLNLLAPQNLKDIEKDLSIFLYEDQRVCRALITEIIGKAQQQPKYASTYAKLCSTFIKKPITDFKFSAGQNINDKKNNNPFRYLLIQKVQHLFDSEEKPNEQIINNKIEKEQYVKNIKKKIIGNVKFIAELILLKTIARKIAKYCITQLLLKFLSYHCLYTKYAKFQHSFYQYYMEAVIQFIQNIGERFDKIDKSDKAQQTKQTQKEKSSLYSYEAALKVVQTLISCTSDPLKEYHEFQDIPVDDFFRIFIIIDEKVLSIKNNRLSSLLKNLEERRDNKWQKHYVGAEGPKKLKDIKEDIENQQNNLVTRVENKSKAALEQLQQQMGQMLKNFQEDDKGWQKKFSTISNNKAEDIILAYLKKFSEDNKDNVLKRVEFFSKILEKNFTIEGFRTKWPQVIKSLSMLSSDLPFCSAALAKILIMISTKRGIRYSDYYIKCEDQDQEYFMNEVYAKLYHYTKNQDIKKFVPDMPEKVSGLI